MSMCSALCFLEIWFFVAKSCDPADEMTNGPMVWKHHSVYTFWINQPMDVWLIVDCYKMIYFTCNLKNIFIYT